MRVVRALLVALFTTGLSIVILLITHSVITLVHHNQADTFMRHLDALAGWLSPGTRGLFAATALNDGVAAAVWLLVTAGTLILTRRAAGRSRRPSDPTKTSPVPTTSKFIFTVVAVTSVLETAGFAGTYLLYSRYYVYTDNATVDGDKIDIDAPATGSVIDWSIDQGSTVHRNQVVGRIRGVGSGEQPQRSIHSPGQGTVAMNAVVNGDYVTAGTELATAYDFAKIYITARIKTTDISEVQPGALVDISAVAFPDTPMSGLVETIQNSTASNFTIYPPAGTADPSQPQRVDQYVPVRIAFINTGGKQIVPGMNVTVHIHKPSPDTVSPQTG